ncbi:MAG: HlyD family efflux transporter periplasmic adaptor subunit, partial [Desulfovibrio sp.]|nr:HlyD family efflux transporter periplasmic adaptor subunit [Desulfovibrio sp.]
EAEISGIKEGDAVEVEIPSLNNRKFKGTVNEISWISTDMNVSNPSYYMVEVTVPNPDLELKPGFKAVVRFKAQ